MSAIEITIFKTNLSDEEIEKLLLSHDSTFAPLGSGGYSVKKRKDGSFLFKQQDCFPYFSAIVRIKKGQIWSVSGLSSFLGIILADLESYSIERMTFKTPQEIRQSFESI